MKSLTITLTLDEWEEIHDEASSHTLYTGNESPAVSKLYDIIENFKEEDE